jgi:hypothetical protein
VYDHEKNLDRLLAQTIVRGSPGIPTREVAFLARWDMVRAFAALKLAEHQGYVQYDANPGPGYEDRWLPLERRPGAYHHAERLRRLAAERAADPTTASPREHRYDSRDAVDEGEPVIWHQKGRWNGVERQLNMDYLGKPEGLQPRPRRP